MSANALPELNPRSDTNKIFDDTHAAFSLLQEYNTAYNTYLVCVESTRALNVSSNTIAYHPEKCTSATFQQQGEKLLAAFNTLNEDIQTYSQKTKHPDGTVLASAPFGKANIETKQQYQDMVKLRNELDLKLRELYNMPDSRTRATQLEGDTATYAMICWTVLATSLLYYLFVKL